LLSDGERGDHVSARPASRQNGSHELTINQAMGPTLESGVNPWVAQEMRMSLTPSRCKSLRLDSNAKLLVQLCRFSGNVGFFCFEPPSVANCSPPFASPEAISN
jgi:hypothetical protein